MTKCHFHQVIVLLFTFLCLLYGQDLNQENIKNDDSNTFNVIFFLAKTNPGERYIQDSGIKYLNFVEKKRVKHFASPNYNDENEGGNCKQLLKAGIYSLISYCRNVMGMSTAIASMENDTFSNDLRFKKSISEDLEIRYHTPRHLRAPSNSFSDMAETQERHVITNPEHTEVFKIRAKRQNNFAEEPPDASDKSEIMPEENENNWDVFGVMANIKLTFFGKLFENSQNLENIPAQVPQRELINQLGKISENCLFNLVKDTLLNVQDNEENGFLMLIIGGNLNEISDVYSNLMQSVKHVIESTDERNTLIILTGQCPVIDQENSEIENDQSLIPVYVKGPPKIGLLAITGQLYDVPYSIKNLLAEMNGGNFFSGVKRRIRSIHPAKARRNKTSRILPIMSSVFYLYLLVSVL